MNRLATVPLGLALVLGACTGGPSGEELHSAARSLVPDGASIVEEVEGRCVELAPDPSCVHVYFVGPEVSLSDRVAAVERRALGAGWRLIDKESLLGGSHLLLERTAMKASVMIRSGEACRSIEPRDCADAAFVEGDFGL